MDRTTYDEQFRVEDVDWEPLERFFCDTNAPELSSFGFAGHWDRPKGGSVRMYMNLDTRHMLMIDEQLECYRLKGDRIRRISRKDALEDAYEGINDFEGWQLRCVPRPLVFPCRHNNWGKGVSPGTSQRRLRVVS